MKLSAGPAVGLLVTAAIAQPANTPATIPPASTTATVQGLSADSTATVQGPSADTTATIPAADTAAPVQGPSAGAKATLVRIRTRPIPDISPPIIDSRTALIPGRSPFIQGTLAFSFSSRYNTVADPKGDDYAGHARNVQDDSPNDNANDAAYFGPQRTYSRDLPEPQAWVRHIAQALVEVMSGARPAAQVIRWTTPEVYSAVARRNAVSTRRAIVARQAIVRRVRICEPVDGVVEGCAVVLDGARVRALAMRLVGVDRRWVVSELQVG